MGRFDTSAMHGAFSRAVTAYRQAHPLVALPSDLRPYDLRHSFGTEAYRRDLEAVRELLQHANLETTRRYIGSATTERAATAVAVMAAARDQKHVAQGRGTADRNRRFTLIKTG